MDRARRNGSSLHSPFNVWIMREAQLMADLVTLIRTHVQMIKAACDLNQFGTYWSEELANVAHANTSLNFDPFVSIEEIYSNNPTVCAMRNNQNSKDLSPSE